MLFHHTEKISQCFRIQISPAALCTFIPVNCDRNLTHLTSRPPVSFRPPQPLKKTFSIPHKILLPPVKISRAFEMFTFSEEEQWAMLLTTFAGLSTSLGALIAVRFLYPILHSTYNTLHSISLQVHLARNPIFIFMLSSL